MNLEVYKWGFNYYFIDNDTKEEGKIILGSANRGNDVYSYVSHLEDCDEEQEDKYSTYLENNFDLILNAKEL